MTWSTQRRPEKVRRYFHHPSVRAWLSYGQCYSRLDVVKRLVLDGYG